MPHCELKAANGTSGVACDEHECVYWRVVEQLGVPAALVPGECAVQHFSLLDGGSEIAAWLLSVKERVETV